MQRMEIWLVILFLSRNKFHAKQMFVLTGFMKSGPNDFDKVIIVIYLIENSAGSTSDVEIFDMCV